MENNIYDFQDYQLEQMFKDRDINRAIEYINNIKEKSINEDEEIYKPKKKHIDEKKLMKAAISFSLSALLIITGLNIAIPYTEDIVNFNKKTENYVATTFGSKRMHDVYSRISKTFGRGTLLSQNTYRLSASEYAYSHNDLANDILSLDYNIQDYTLCATLDDMGANRNNVVIGDKTNADLLISNMKYYNLNGEKIETLDEFLRYFKYLDEENNPSFDKFKQVCNLKVDNIIAILDINLGKAK